MAFYDTSATIPPELRTEHFFLRPIRVSDVELDYEAVMATRESLRLWEQSSWPEDHFTVDDNRADVVEMEERHDAHRAYTYTVLDVTGVRCLGCVYMFPHDASFLTRATITPVGENAWSDCDAAVYFWVRQSEMDQGADAVLLQELRAWFRNEWQLKNVVFVTSAMFQQQVDLFDATDLTHQFELTEPEKAGKFLVYG